MPKNRRESDNRGLTGSVRQTDEIFRRLVEGVQDYAIFLLSPEGKIMTWNAGAERIKGYKASEIIGEHFSRFRTHLRPRKRAGLRESWRLPRQRDVSRTKVGV